MTTTWIHLWTSMIGMCVFGATHAADVPFTERIAPADMEVPRSVIAADMDADGDVDFLAVSTIDDKVAWYENDGERPPEFVERVISWEADSARSVIAADFDGDGDIDAASASRNDDKISWYESDGALPPSFTEHVITFNADSPQTLFAADVDGDGDTDLLSASYEDNTIAWYENCSGTPLEFTEHLISTNAIHAVAVCAADLDGDGDIDVVSGSLSDDKIAWYANDGGSPPRFTEHLITDTAFHPRAVHAADLDGDGDTDLIAAIENDNLVAWFENDGAATPSFTQRAIDEDARNAHGVVTADVDGDGHLDVVSAQFGDDEVVWHENDGASPPAFTPHVLSGTTDGAAYVDAADFDGDGDIDILAASMFADTIAWFQNCPDDVDGDRDVGIDDLMAVVLDWNTEGTANDGDVNASGFVDVDDLVEVLLNWGPC